MVHPSTSRPLLAQVSALSTESPVVDFRFDDDQALLRETTRRFLDNRHPLAALRPVLEADEVVDLDVWREGGALGWTAMLIDPDHGGGSVTDQPLIDLVALAEELGRVLHPFPLLPTNVVADAIGRFGTEEQRKGLLPGLAAGDLVAAWCLTADGSPDADAVEVTASPTDDGFRLDGVARYVHGATVAGLLLVAARVEAGLAHLLVPMGTAGVAVRRLDGLDLTRRLGEVRFAGASIGADAVLADGPWADALLGRALSVATVVQAAEAVGAAEHLFEATVQYAKDRVQFGRPIGSFQAIKHRLADLFITVAAMRAATHDAALALSEGTADAAEAVAVAGSYVADAFAHLCGEALQLHGGIGFTWEHDVHLFVRRAKVDQVLYGEPAWHRERLVRLLEAG
jgi:alkylation response protein AidB-like acyl-CoA dehydrogenase